MSLAAYFLTPIMTSSQSRSRNKPLPRVDIPNNGSQNRLYHSPSASYLPYESSRTPIRRDSGQQQQQPLTGRTNGSSNNPPNHRRQISGPNNLPSRNSLLTPEPYSPYSPHGNVLRHPVGAAPPNGYAHRPVSFVEGSSTSSYDPAAAWRFPEPELHLHRSFSQASLRQQQQSMLNRPVRSDIGPNLTLQRMSSYSSMEQSPQESTEELTDELSHMTLESEEGLKRFQSGQLQAADEEWHRLVPESAREALGNQEVQRQSVMFEVFKSERDYVRDLEAIQAVFIDRLDSAAVMPEDQVHDFIKEVFWNLDEILSFHLRMLGELFSRQREQHPLIQSVADIVLETALQFTSAYESYIKHYPIAEARHRDELRRNEKYAAFIQGCMHDPRIKKRDLITFISRPVTRLPRLSLLLEHILKLTDKDHPDLRDMPLIISILGDLIKSTQPGIEAAENKVKFWSLVENMVFKHGEIIDLDLYDENRSLQYSGTLGRRQRSDTDWYGWTDYFVVLLDHYLLLTREVKTKTGVKYDVASRPIPLDLLRLGQFDEPAESRKEKSEEGGILENLRSHSRPVYPFTIYHAAQKTTRRYTLYTNTEAARKKWKDALVSTIGINDVRQDSNKWFAPSTLNDGSFRIRTIKVPPTSTDYFTGRLTAAAAFSSGGKKYLAIGCGGGLYVGLRGEKFRRVLPYQNPTSLIALQEFNKFLIHHETSLYSYSLDLLARVSQESAPASALEASLEKVSAADQSVTYAQVGLVKRRTIVIYASKGFRQTTIYAYEVVNTPNRPRRNPGESLAFRSFGQPFYVPRQAFAITPLSKTVAIATEKGVTIIDPTNLSNTAMMVVPDLSQASSDPHIYALKTKCDDARPLGLARVDLDEIMVIYEEFGCFVSRHGTPRRDAAIIRWEIKATNFAQRWDHILLFSSDFIEVRHAKTGRFVQAIEGREIRLVNTDPTDNTTLLVARLGTKDDKSGQSDELLELVKTTEIASPSATSSVQSWPGELSRTSTADSVLWSEWDM